MRAHRSQSYAGACAAAGENESGDGRARAGHVSAAELHSRSLALSWRKGVNRERHRPLLEVRASTLLLRGGRSLQSSRDERCGRSSWKAAGGRGGGGIFLAYIGDVSSSVGKLFPGLGLGAAGAAGASTSCISTAGREGLRSARGASGALSSALLSSVCTSTHPASMVVQLRSRWTSC